MMLLDFLLAGLVIGGIYALISIGLNLQYGVARVLNLAYGEFLMLAGYGAFWGFTLLGAPPLLTVLVGAPLAFALSWLLFRYVLHPLLGAHARPGQARDRLRSSPPSACCSCCRAWRWWPGPAPTAPTAISAVPVNMFGAVIGANRLVVLRRRAGAVGRRVSPSCATRRPAAPCAPSPPARAPRRWSASTSPATARIAFATGGALAAIAGILLSSFVGINPTIGAAFTMKALIVVVMGGIGHVLGGLVAGLILGLAETHGGPAARSGPRSPSSTSPSSRSCCCGGRRACSAAAPVGRAAPRLRIPKEAVALAALAALLLVPRFADAYWLSLLVNILTYVALATGWAFFSGATRYVSLAASAFFGVGAYSVAVLAPDYSYAVALAAAVGISIVLSAFVGLATLRLSGMYFVIFTFGLATLVRETVTWWEFNIAQKAGRHLFLSITTTHIYYQLLALCVAIIALWLMRDRSRMGFALKTLGADETVARQIGINTVALKIGTFVVSSVVMTLAGAILAPRWSYMDATVAFNPNTSFLTVIMALLGGATSVWGPMLGVVPLVLISDYLSVDRAQLLQRRARAGAARHRVLHPQRPDRPAAAWRAPACSRDRIASRLHALADRIGGRARRAPSRRRKRRAEPTARSPPPARRRTRRPP